MSKSSFSQVFPQKLKFWIWHCAVNACPSFLIASVWLGLWNWVAQFAMIAAILTFVLCYSVATSLPGPLTNSGSLFSRALKLGLKLRMIISILTVCAVPLGVVLMYTPDYWCGWAAVIVVERVFDAMGLTAVLMQGVDEGSGGEILVQAGFWEVYLTTLLEGLILSLMLFIFSLFSIVFLQMRERKRMFREVAATRGYR
ncbi:hypothetical protein [Luteolibacter sp. AS25]|uniref:hypothetical protein n=1 Tax=Luteolibacter sp. AS25 TaxID=3135776 RepID=UPI00398AB57E